MEDKDKILEESVDNKEMYESSSAEDKFAELEIAKEMMRISKEVSLKTENIHKEPKFMKGVQDGLSLAGFYSALVSCGISVKMAEELVLNRQTGQTNITLNTANNKTALEISKISSDKAKDMAL